MPGGDSSAGAIFPGVGPAALLKLRRVKEVEPRSDWYLIWGISDEQDDELDFGILGDVALPGPMVPTLFKLLDAVGFTDELMKLRFGEEAPKWSPHIRFTFLRVRQCGGLKYELRAIDMHGDTVGVIERTFCAQIGSFVELGKSFSIWRQ
jgi:hypothetical protein